MKKYLEAQLGRVQVQLQQLNKARAQLIASIQERSRVTDLLCQSMTPSSQFQSSNSLRSSSTRHLWNGKGRSGSSLEGSVSQSVMLNGSGQGGSMHRRQHPKTLSAPANNSQYDGAVTVGEYYNYCRV